MRTTHFPVLATIVLGSLAPQIWACDTGSVRDAALHAKRDVYHLCLIARRNDAAAEPALKQLEAWLHGDADQLNVELERIDADDANVRWRDYGIPSVPPSLPVVALIGEFPSPRRTFVIDHWEPGPSANDLAALRTSPVREAIKEAIISRWAVILYAPGPGKDKDAVEAALQAVDRKWAEDQPPGLSVIRFDRADPRERLLCAFAGIRPSGPDWAGVVFGRGKLMAPPLLGEDITEQNLNELLGGLAAACTCLQQSMTLGLDIPMAWEPALDAKIAAVAPSQGYVEKTLDPPGAPARAAALVEDVPRADRHIVTTAVVPLICAGLAAVIAIVLVVWRTRAGARNPASSEE